MNRRDLLKLFGLGGVVARASRGIASPIIHETVPVEKSDPPRSMLIIGSAGSGKTALVKHLAKSEKLVIVDDGPYWSDPKAVWHCEVPPWRKIYENRIDRQKAGVYFVQRLHRDYVVDQNISVAMTMTVNRQPKSCDAYFPMRVNLLHYYFSQVYFVEKTHSGIIRATLTKNRLGGVGHFGDFKVNANLELEEVWNYGGTQ